MFGAIIKLLAGLGLAVLLGLMWAYLVMWVFIKTGGV